MSAEISELRPGRREYTIISGQPFGQEAVAFLDATLHTRRKETRKAYDTPTRMLSWNLSEIPSQQPMVKKLHLLPDEGAVIIEGKHAPSSYPVSPDNYGSSGKLPFTRIVAEAQSGTVTIEYQAAVHGKSTAQKLDVTRHGQLTLHKSEPEVAEEHITTLPRTIEEQSVVDPGYGNDGPETNP